MSAVHPSDEELLRYADGEAPGGVGDHLAGCGECRGAVEAARAGRNVLRAAPLLELPAERREAVLAALPPHERRRTRRRFLGVAIPLVAVAAAVAVVGLSGGRSDTERTAGDFAAEADERQAPSAGESAPALEAAPAEDAAALRPVAGPPEEVAELLRAQGLDARVAGGSVEVRGASRAAVERALRSRADGEVEIRIR